MTTFFGLPQRHSHKSAYQDIFGEPVSSVAFGMLEELAVDLLRNGRVGVSSRCCTSVTGAPAAVIADAQLWRRVWKVTLRRRARVRVR